MSSVIDLDVWRTRSEHGANASPTPDDIPRALRAADIDHREVDRLDRAVDRLNVLISGAIDGAGRLQPSVETELLAIVGELTVGLVNHAADRAERLAARLGS